MSKKKTQKELEVSLYVFTNDPKEEGTMALLQMFYQGAFDNTVGIMRALNTDTGKVESILVGLVSEDGVTSTYPLAKVLDPQDAQKYLSPDGNGGYFERE